MDSNSNNARDLLNSTHRFPCQFLFKVIGVSRDELETEVLLAIREVIGPDQVCEISVKVTPGGRHQAISSKPWVADADVVLEIYESLRQIEGIVMVL